MADAQVDGDKLQELATSVRVIEVEMKSMRELLDSRLDDVVKSSERITLMLKDHNKRIYQNEKDIAKTAAWTTIVGSIISVAVAISYLIR